MSLTVPNLLTLARMGLIPFFIIAVLDGQALRALAIFCLAGITDALDGFIARFFGQRSALGAYLDPIADKLLLTSAYVMLAIPGLHSGVLIPIWVTVLVIAPAVALEQGQHPGADRRRAAGAHVGDLAAVRDRRDRRRAGGGRSDHRLRPRLHPAHQPAGGAEPGGLATRLSRRLPRVR
jgi:hypothetical protein